MRIAFFSTYPFVRQFFDLANRHHHHDISYFEPRLTSATAPLAAGAPAVCAFVNDGLDEATLRPPSAQRHGLRGERTGNEL